ncbi:hypothetical protein A0H81_06408 [Grifola frondosa]|uniref:Uncharacterized protein n=1 Tax=Grifola frondosa TaxID=5627 RepID=A0A1C7MF48_GRIFR|nr:hypothetical protein A0H81_06408 [Grifola frondosa]
MTRYRVSYPSIFSLSLTDCIDIFQPIPAYVQIDASDAQRLSEKLAMGDLTVTNEEDVKAFGSMHKRGDFPIYAHITALHPDSIESERAEWTGARGWFDELVKVSKRRAMEDAWPWTGTPEAANQAEPEPGTVKLSSSYRGFDLDMWDDVQDERDRSLTLPHAEEELLDVQIRHIHEVIDH